MATRHKKQNVVVGGASGFVVFCDPSLKPLIYTRVEAAFLGSRFLKLKVFMKASWGSVPFYDSCRNIMASHMS